MTFKDLAQLTMENKNGFVKASTLELYKLNLRKHILPVFGNQDSLKTEDLQKFIYDKSASGLSYKTVHDIMMTIRMIQTFGEERGIFPHCVWSLRYPEAQPQKRIPTMSVCDQRKFMEYLESHPSLYNLGILLCLNTGMRIGELCGLKWSDIDWATGLLTVSRTVERVYFPEEHRTKIMEGSPKTKNSYRTIPLSKPIIRMAKQMRKKGQSELYVLSGELSPKDPRIFRDYFTRLLARQGLPRIKFHGLRHTFATRCVESKCDVKTLSSILGHANVATTLNIYVHPSESQKATVITQMLKRIRL